MKVYFDSNLNAITIDGLSNYLPNGVLVAQSDGDNVIIKYKDSNKYELYVNFSDIQMENGTSAGANSIGVVNYLNNQFLQSSKANLVHSHTISDITGLQTAIDGKSEVSHNHTSSNITDFNESVEDIIGVKVVAGTNITVDYNDITGETTINSSGGATNLTYTPSATNGIVNSDTGTDATIPLANGTNAGLSLNDYTTAEKSKLAGIDTGATANSSDATLLNRANHTGTQTASTISDFNTQVATTATLKSNNLSDLTNTTTARTNLGLGSLATQSGTFTAIPQANVTNLTTDLAGKQATLVSGTNIKTVNGSSILGSGDLVISGGSSNLDALTDVVITTPTNGQTLSYNGTNWINSTPSGGGNAITSNGLQQFTGTTFSELGVISTPASPTAGNVKIYGKQEIAEDVFAYKNAQGQEFFMQDAIFLGRKKGWFFNGTTTVNLFGQAAALSAVGTLTAAAVATTSDFTKRTGSEYLVTTAATTAIAGFRESANSFWLGNTAGDGGFSFTCTFGPATGIATATHRLFVGMSTSTAAPTDVEPSSLLNMFGLGYDSADANMQIMRNDGTGTATKIDLGANFVVPTVDRSNYYRLDLYAAPNSTTIYYKVTNLTNGNVASGNFNTDIPAVNTLMSARGWISVGGTSSVIGIKVSNLEVDSIK